MIFNYMNFSFIPTAYAHTFAPGDRIVEKAPLYVPFTQVLWAAAVFFAVIIIVFVLLRRKYKKANQFDLYQQRQQINTSQEEIFEVHSD
jgi:cytochrome c-type biogenesis protein CcmH/NrfF